MCLCNRRMCVKQETRGSGLNNMWFAARFAAKLAWDINSNNTANASNNNKHDNISTDNNNNDNDCHNNNGPNNNQQHAA
ncbi:hypothetical protein N9L68_08080 [bacterium]|nr:hypothetical protein [bacterium]